MKLLAVLIFTFNMISTPAELSVKCKLISSEVVDVFLIKSEDSDEGIFQEANYNTDYEQLEFTTSQTITTIRIFDSNGLLEFQMPVMSRRVLLSKSIFGTGEYVLGFLMEGTEDIHLTQVNFF